MTSCDHCENQEPECLIWSCATCDAQVCADHYGTNEDGLPLCAPPKNGPLQQRGCYKPPVAEVVENDLQTLSVAGLLRIQRASQED